MTRGEEHLMRGVNKKMIVTEERDVTVHEKRPMSHYDQDERDDDVPSLTPNGHAGDIEMSSLVIC